MNIAEQAERSRADIISQVAECLLCDDTEMAEKIIQKEYPFTRPEAKERTYTLEDKLQLFFRDGFIDRYSGDKLINPGMLRVISKLLPDSFPFHAHWKASECHLAFWHLMPSLDHINPVALGGKDIPDNWATTSGFRNQAKGLASLKDMGWTLHKPGRIEDWDGLSKEFVEIVEKKPELLNDKTIKDWYRGTKNLLSLSNVLSASPLVFLETI